MNELRIQSYTHHTVLRAARTREARQPSREIAKSKPATSKHAHRFPRRGIRTIASHRIASIYTYPERPININQQQTPLYIHTHILYPQLIAPRYCIQDYARKSRCACYNTRVREQNLKSCKSHLASFAKATTKLAALQRLQITHTLY